MSTAIEDGCKPVVRAGGMFSRGAIDGQEDIQALSQPSLSVSTRSRVEREPEKTVSRMAFGTSLKNNE